MCSLPIDPFPGISYPAFEGLGQAFSECKGFLLYASAFWQSSSRRSSQPLMQADAHCFSSSGQTNLLACKQLQDYDCAFNASFLQAKPLAATAYRDTALHQAIRQSLMQLVAEMLDGVPGSVLDGLADSQQNNPLHAATLAGNSPQAVQVVLLLLRSGMTLESPGAPHNIHCSKARASLQSWARSQQ